MVRNRARWTIDAIHPDGSLTATGRHGTIHLPARYVAEHVELAYATTAAAAQGRTVDHALVVIDRPCDVRNLYVAMTRGTPVQRRLPGHPRRADRRMTSSPTASSPTGSTSPPTPAKPNSEANHHIGPGSSTAPSCATCSNAVTSSPMSWSGPKPASNASLPRSARHRPPRPQPSRRSRRCKPSSAASRA